MKCLHPVDAWQCGYTFCKADGVISPRLVFSYNEAANWHLASDSTYDTLKEVMDKNYMPVPCGKCDACTMRKRKDMSVRLAHEASMHERCCFVTLTYDDAKVPWTDSKAWTHSHKLVSRGTTEGLCDAFGSKPYLTLLPRDVQLFLKRLRRYLEYVPRGTHVEKLPTGAEMCVDDKSGEFVREHCSTSIRYFAVGEYGSKTHRPHYHLLIFGWHPIETDYLFTRNGHDVFKCPAIEDLWEYGYNTIEDVTPGAAKYCARYVTKKFQEKKFDWSKCVCPTFTLQSTRSGGMGAGWVDANYNQLKTGYVLVRENERTISKNTIPGYYLRRLRNTRLSLWLDLRNERIAFLREHPDSQEDIGETLRKVLVDRLEQERLAGFEVL